MTRRAIYIHFLLGLGIAATASAAEGENNLFAGDIGNAVWTIVIFALVIFVLGKFAWGPLLSTLQQREEFIRESLVKAKEDREESEALLAKYSEKLDEARAEATAIVEEGRRDAEAVKRRVEEETREEQEKILARSKREIDIAKQTAIREIYTSSARLATDAAAKILGRELSAADHERLIVDSIQELEGLES